MSQNHSKSTNVLSIKWIITQLVNVSSNWKHRSTSTHHASIRAARPLELFKQGRSEAMACKRCPGAKKWVELNLNFVEPCPKGFFFSRKCGKLQARRKKQKCSVRSSALRTLAHKSERDRPVQNRPFISLYDLLRTVEKSEGFLFPLFFSASIG